jgi:hypothetical protein
MTLVLDGSRARHYRGARAGMRLGNDIIIGAGYGAR